MSSYRVWDDDQHLSVSVFSLGWVELPVDRGQASHSASSCIVLQMVPVRLAKRQPEETFFTVFIFSVLFLFSLSITPGYSLCLFLLFLFYFCPYSISPPSPSSPCHPSISILFPLSFLLEDSRCKQSSSQRHTLHTISLAFKGVEYSQLCWKLNSLKPPFPLQQFIVGEFSVFGEQLGLSRGWCQRAPIVPCSTAVSPSFCDRKEQISNVHFTFLYIQKVYPAVREV